MYDAGVDRSNSLKMWLEYFPNAFIYGIDISGKKLFTVVCMYVCMYLCNVCMFDFIYSE